MFYTYTCSPNAVQKDIKKINRITKCVSKMTGVEHDLFLDIFENYLKKKFNRILKDDTHPLFCQLNFSVRSGRILYPKVKKERYNKSFLPTAIKLYSKDDWRGTGLYSSIILSTKLFCTHWKNFIPKNK